MSPVENAHNRLSRRDFLKVAAVEGAAVVGSGLLAGCGAGSATSNMPDKWDKEADVVVVGYGGAGAIAAIAALEAGAEVIVLEKREVPGGSNAICGGVYYAVGTSVQLVEVTQPLEVEWGRNPHNSHWGEMECHLCHNMHRPSVNYCASCHQVSMPEG